MTPIKFLPVLFVFLLFVFCSNAPAL